MEDTYYPISDISKKAKYFDAVGVTVEIQDNTVSIDRIIGKSSYSVFGTLSKREWDITRCRSYFNIGEASMNRLYNVLSKAINAGHATIALDAKGYEVEF